MKALNVEQNTPEWMEARSNRFTASEAGAMMGVSPHQSRDDLLRQKATGIKPDVDAATQRIFDRGHELEAMARPIAEALLKDGLYPLTGVHDDHDWMLASFDGITLDGLTVWECKTLNNKLRESLAAGVIPDQYHPQLEQQLLVSGAERVLFMGFDGETEMHAWYDSNPVLLDQLLYGWKQFKEDLANYTPPTEVSAEVVAEPIESLPTLTVQITGGVTKSNLDDYKAYALDFIRNINTDLKTDEDFAQAEAVVKFCASTEKELEAVKQAALNQTADIADLFKAIDEVRTETRTKRLITEKLIKARKQMAKEERIMNARKAFNDHLRNLQARISNVVDIPDVDENFAGVIKNKRTIASLENAINTELARIKIKANELTDRIDGNINIMLELAPEHRFLFMDLQKTCTKDADDFTAMVKTRLAEHEAAEAKKLAAERERIRKEEEAKAEAKAAAERRRIHQEEQAKARAEMEAERQLERKAQAEAQAKEESAVEQVKQAEKPAPTVQHTPAPNQAAKQHNFDQIVGKLKAVINEAFNYTPERFSAALHQIADEVR